MRDRHLAGTEAVDADLVLQLVEPRVDLGVELGRRHHDLEFALQAFGQCFGHLHDRQSFSFVCDARRRSRDALVPSACRGVVRAEGLEPPRLSSLEPKSSASTSSATPAKGASEPRPPPGGAAYIMLLRRRTKKMGMRRRAPPGYVRPPMRPLHPLTRRTVIAGTGLAATLALLGAPARAQGDGFRMIRARETGYDGAVPGPVLRMQRGEELKVRLVNELAPTPRSTGTACACRTRWTARR